MSFSVQNPHGPGFGPGETRRLLLQTVRGLSTEKQCALAMHLTPILCKNLPLAHKILEKISQKVRVGLTVTFDEVKDTDGLFKFNLYLRDALLNSFNDITFSYKNKTLIKRLIRRFNTILKEDLFSKTLNIDYLESPQNSAKITSTPDESINNESIKLTIQPILDGIKMEFFLSDTRSTMAKLANAIKERIFPGTTGTQSINEVELKRFFHVGEDDRMKYSQLLNKDSIFDLLGQVRDGSVKIKYLSGQKQPLYFDFKTIKILSIGLKRFTPLLGPWLLRAGFPFIFQVTFIIDYLPILYHIYQYNYLSSKFVPDEKKYKFWVFTGLIFFKAFALRYIGDNDVLKLSVFSIDVVNGILEQHLMSVGGLSTRSVAYRIAFAITLEVLSKYLDLKHLLESRESKKQVAMNVLTVRTDEDLANLAFEDKININVKLRLNQTDTAQPAQYIVSDTPTETNLVESFINANVFYAKYVIELGKNPQNDEIVDETKKKPDYIFLVAVFNDEMKKNNINSDNPKQYKEFIIRYLFNGLCINSPGFFSIIGSDYPYVQNADDSYKNLMKAKAILKGVLTEGIFSTLITAIVDFNLPTSELAFLMDIGKDGMISSIFYDFGKNGMKLIEPLSKLYNSPPKWSEIQTLMGKFKETWLQLLVQTNPPPNNTTQSGLGVLNAARTSSNPIISTLASAVLQKLLKGMFFTIIQKLQSGKSPKMAVKSVTDQLLGSNNGVKSLPYEKELNDYSLVKDDVLYQVYTMLCNTSPSFSPPAGLFNFHQSTRGLIARYATLAGVDEMQYARGVLKSIQMRTGPEIELAENARSCQILSNVMSLGGSTTPKKDLNLTRRSDSLFALTSGKLFLRKSTPLDVQYGPNLHSVSLNAVFHSDRSHVSALTRHCGGEGELLSFNDLYQSMSGPMWFESRFTKDPSQKLGLELQLFQSQGENALLEIMGADPTKYLSQIICRVDLMPDILDIDTSVRIYHVPALRFLVDVLKKEVRPAGFLYKSEAVNVAEVLPKAFFLKTAKLDLSNGVHEIPEYKGVEYLLSRAYFGNLRFRFQSVGDKLTCHEMTEDVLHFIAAFLLYRKSDLFTEPVKPDAFWSKDVSGTILENVFNAMKQNPGSEYDSYSSSSGVPVFGNGGNGGVAILPEEFCVQDAIAEDVQSNAQAQVVSLLRGICARYSPGARQAAAY